jgi:glycosyltransferase involved in cell wall biosynthesis
MRIAQLVTCRQLRGAEVFAHQLCEELDRLGHATSILYLYRSDHDGGPPLRAADRVLEGSREHPAERIPGFHPGLLFRLQRLVRGFDPDVVQVNGSRTVKYGGLLRWFSPRARWALVYRSIGDPRRWLVGERRAAIYRRVVISRIDGAVAVSSNTMRSLKSWHRFTGPMTRIPRGVDPARLVPEVGAADLRASLGTPPGRSVALFVGSLSPEKRPDRFIRAVMAARRRGADVEGWMVGDGALRSALESSEPGAGAAIRFLGAQQDVASYMAAADVLLLTSDTEGLPGVVLEAGVLGKASIATRVGGVEEAVLDRVTGVLVGAEDEEGLAGALLDLLRDPALRCRLGERAREWVLREFAIDRIAQRYLEFYGSLGERRRAVDTRPTRAS